MKDDQHKRDPSASRVGSDEIRRLAKRALDMLVSDQTRTATSARAQLTELCDAYIAPSGDLYREALARVQGSGASTQELIDHVIPAAARLMGERWFADEISFADVSIGTARLQETVRWLATRDRFRDQSTGHFVQRPTILMVLPRGEHHSLGLIVATDQFRRMGYRVEVAVDEHPVKVSNMVREREFVLVGIAVVSRRTLASAKDIVESIRTTVTRYTPIVIGGVQFATPQEVIAATGVDHVVEDAKSALRACGLQLSPGNDENAPDVDVEVGMAHSVWKGSER